MTDQEVPSRGVRQRRPCLSCHRPTTSVRRPDRPVRSRRLGPTVRKRTTSRPQRTPVRCTARNANPAAQPRSRPYSSGGLEGAAGRSAGCRHPSTALRLRNAVREHSGHRRRTQRGVERQTATLDVVAQPETHGQSSSGSVAVLTDIAEAIVRAQAGERVLLQELGVAVVPAKRPRRRRSHRGRGRGRNGRARSLSTRLRSPSTGSAGRQCRSLDPG